MKKTIKFVAMLCGAVATVAGFSSCSKDDEKTECCSYVYSDDVDVSVTACEDGTYSMEIDGIEVYSGQDDISSSEWDEFKEIVKEYGGSCS